MITNSVNTTMTGLFGRNWRTSTSGIITAVAGFIAANPDMIKNETIVNLAKFITFAGVAMFGLNAKDKQVSGIKPQHWQDDTLAEQEARRDISGDK